MISDLDLQLTPSDGQLFDAVQGAAERGTRPVKIGTGTYPGVDQPLACYFCVVDANSNIGALGIDIELMTDDDGAGTNEVSVLKKAALLAASLTTAKGVQCLGVVPQGQKFLKYATLKVTTRAAAAATAGKIKAWLQKANIAAPVNEGVII